MSTVTQAIASIEVCGSIEELSNALQKIAEHYGFCSFNFLDTGHAHADVPMYFGTTGTQWEQDYIANEFVHFDPCIQKARRTNTPFHWGEVALPDYRSGHKPKALEVMEAAQDYGFKNGLVVPFHFRDQLGRMCSTLCVFYWSSQPKRFKFLLSRKKHELHLILIYWVQQAIDIIAIQHRGKGSPFVSPDSLRGVLSDRERDVLSWAARGKTVSETSDILTISDETVSTHVRNAVRKLGATNKTSATVKAIYMGLIDV